MKTGMFFYVSVISLANVSIYLNLTKWTANKLLWLQHNEGDIYLLKTQAIVYS